MKSGYAKRERGVALLAMLAVIALGASWYLVSRLNAESGVATAVRKARNAEVLNRAKQALIGYVAIQAAATGERNPGRLPCPEHPWYVNPNDLSKEGVSGPSVGVANPGVGAPTADCTTIGRLPWRTLGLDKLIDTTGEPLWYVVGPSWRLTTSTSTLLINSNTPAGDITVDGQQTVALIVAPGAAMNVQASPPLCAARNQARAVPSQAMDARDYIECFDSGTLQFITTASSTSFNDQVMRVTVADIMPGIEAAVAKRIERDIVPVLKTVYTPSIWGFSGSNPIYPFAAPFANPGPGAGSSTFQGAAGIYQGLPPFNQTQGCISDPANPRCLPWLIAWSGTPADATEVYGYGYLQTQTCSWVSADIRDCTGEYHEYTAEPWRPVRIQMTATFNYVAMGLRAIDASKMTVDARDNGTVTWLPQATDYTATMDSNGSVTLTFGATLPNIDTMVWGTYAEYRIRLDRAVIGDHALLSSTDATTGWFARNEWYRLAYYAVARGHTADPLPSTPACTTSVNCVSVANVAPANAQRAILILAGGSINGSTRPSATLSNYLEFGNATGAFVRQTVRASVATPVAQRFNDRIVVIDAN